MNHTIISSVSWFRAASFALLAGSVCLTLIGCGERSRPKLVPMSGTVTINGELPPKPGVVQLNPIEVAEGYDRHPAVGRFDTTGHYKASTFAQGDGITPGKYAVGLECFESPPQADEPLPKNYAPEKWRSPSNSGVEVTISPDEESKQFDIKATD
jgi:hypothetical protein